jgi:glycosyltransferase involved in cell wall biosynthesis
MKVLWFAAGAMPIVRERLNVMDLGNRNVWVTATAAALSARGDMELGIVWASPLVAESAEFEVDGITYFCVPAGGRLESISNRLRRTPRRRKVWQVLTYFFRQSARGPLQEMAGIINRYNPDLVHIHGTEGCYGLLAGRTQMKVVISLQGILHAVADAYWGSIPTWRRPQFLLEMLLHWQMRRNAKRENRIIRQAQYFTGRTDWDRRMLAGINPAARYYSDGARLLRKEFYGPEWALRNITRKRLYTTATSRPYKGTDTLLDAVALLRKAHPDISLHIGGHFPERGYGAFLRQRIQTLDLADHVKLLGFVEADDIIAELKAAHAFVLGSYIENSPNSVAEAQLVGAPTIATDAGGTPSLVTDGVSGLLYPAGDAPALARQLERLFADDRLADTLSLGGRKCAQARGGEQELVDTLVTVYRQILADRSS